MANSSIDPGRRNDDLHEPGAPADDPETGPAAGPDVTPEPGRDYVLGDPDAPPLGERPHEFDEDPIDPHGPGAADPHDDEVEDHGGRSGFAATALKILMLALVIFGLSLWIVPNLAPHLPAGVSRHLMPGQAVLDERLAALSGQIETGTAGVGDELAALREQVATLSRQVAAAEATAQSAQASAADSAAAAERNAVAGDAVARAEEAAAEASRLADTATTAATESGRVAAAATRDTASLARRMAGFEARIAELADRVQAVSDSLAEGLADGEASIPELTASVAELRAEVETFRGRLTQQPEFLTVQEADRFATQDDLRSARLALSAAIDQALAALPPADAIVVEQELQALRQEAESAIGTLAGRLEEVESTAAEAARAAGTAEEATSQAVGRVDDAIREASLRAVSAALASRLATGAPFADALQEAADLKGGPAPAELAAVAETGVPTSNDLLRRFGGPARDAIEADIEARSGGGILGQASARVRSVIAGRPAGEQPGETVEAMLSRIEARLRQGEPAAALAEAEALPQPARDALGEWLDRLRARVAAAEAAEQWLDGAVGGTQG